MTLRGNDPGNGLADDFGAGVTVHALRGGIPTGNDAVGIGADDCVTRGFDNCRQMEECLLEPFAFGDVLIDGDEVGDLAALIAHGGDRHLLCVEAAVLAAIDHFAAPDTTGGDGSPESAIEAGVMLARLESAWCFPDDLFRRIARLGAERRIDPENDAVGIGNDDTVGGSLERRTLEAQLLLRPFALGDVAGDTGRANHLASIVQDRALDGLDLGAVACSVYKRLFNALALA